MDDASEPRRPEASDLRKARYLDLAYAALSKATVDDLLQFLSLRHVAGSATARFYDAYPSRAELLAALQDDAADPVQATSAATTPETMGQFVTLAGDLNRKQPQAVERLKELARVEFDSYFTPGTTQASRELLRNVMVFAAQNDDQASDRMTRFYTTVTGQYAQFCGALLNEIGREPIDSLGTVENFVTILSAVYDGLGILARIEGPDRARELLGDVLIPLVVGLTQPIGADGHTDADLLFGSPGGDSEDVPPPSATT